MSDYALKPDYPAETDDALQRRIVVALQQGLPLCLHPYREVAETLGITEQGLMQQLQTMKQSGAVRRVGVVPNHYALGYSHNLMVVWDVDDQYIADKGHEIGQLDFVSHCYRRPRRTGWTYNMFTMVHGRTDAEVQLQIDHIEKILGDAVRDHTALRSTKILKKTGLRLQQKET
jgi:DNA-binding Lrp family transcriptional regulator